jgi:hypothetical protein
LFLPIEIIAAIRAIANISMSIELLISKNEEIANDINIISNNLKAGHLLIKLILQKNYIAYLENPINQNKANRQKKQIEFSTARAIGAKKNPADHRPAGIID